MILLTTDEIKKLHLKIINKTGGRTGIRDIGLLESAVASANAGFGNFERYPTVEEKSARLCFSLISNHAFVDGNKRIGILVLLMTLDLNNIRLKYQQDELVELGIEVAAKNVDYEFIYNWICNHKVKEVAE